jgi:hypothetical protein
MRMRRLCMAGFCLVSGLLANVVVVSSTQAAGPVWITAAGELKATESKKIGSFGNLSILKITDGAGTIECGRATKGGSANEIKGGNPGTSSMEILATECRFEGRPNCLATGVTPKVKEAGEIKTVLKAMLVYPKGRTNSEEEAWDAFFPKEANNELVTFKLENKPGTIECGALNGAEVQPVASGTEIEIPTFKEKRRCGMLAEVGEVAAGKFKKSKGNTRATKVALNFPSPPKTEAEYWNGTAFAAMTCKFEIGIVASEEIGESSFELEGGEAFGWKV